MDLNYHCFADASKYLHVAHDAKGMLSLVFTDGPSVQEDIEFDIKWHHYYNERRTVRTCMCCRQSSWTRSGEVYGSCICHMLGEGSTTPEV